MGCGSTKEFNFDSLTNEDKEVLQESIKLLKSDEFQQIGLMIMTRVVSECPDINSYWKTSTSTASEWKKQIKNHGCKFLKSILICVNEKLHNKDDFLSYIKYLSPSHSTVMLSPKHEKVFLSSFLESMMRECGASWNKSMHSIWTKFIKILWSELLNQCSINKDNTC
ncbi:hypothetical protein GJ496_011461 [Pomphorhynchus laevis]|nr:hypothetical protein GJ496_011461 [Pomphorhynchus laevis]